MKWNFLATSVAMLTGAALASTALISAAHAQTGPANPPCSPRASIIERLTTKYAEQAIAIGMASNGGVVEVLAAEAKGGTWTIIVTMPNGISCLLATGQNFEILAPSSPVKGDPA